MMRKDIQMSFRCRELVVCTDPYALGLGSDEDMENTLSVGPVKLLLSSVDFFGSSFAQPLYSLLRASSASVDKQSYSH